MTWPWVVLGGMVGASLRLAAGVALPQHHARAFPWGTFVANLVGCLVLGGLVGAAAQASVPTPVQLLVGGGVCGALTTWSTFAWETVRLVEEGARRTAVVNVVLSVVAGLGAVALGLTGAGLVLG